MLEQEERLLKPVFTDKDITYMWIKVNNIYMVSVAKGNPNVAMVLTFLYKIRDCFVSYFKELEDESLRDNFVITYELLDEMMDHGYPQITEEKVLHEYIKTEANKMAKEKSVMGNLKKFTGADRHSSNVQNLSVPTAASNAVSWRPENIRYAKNEVFLDVIEKLNLLVSSNGTVLRSEILGAVKMKCNLTGMPELKLGLNDKLQFEASGKRKSGAFLVWCCVVVCVIASCCDSCAFRVRYGADVSKGKAVELEDINFHQCVRLARCVRLSCILFVRWLFCLTVALRMCSLRSLYISMRNVCRLDALQDT